MPSFPTLGEPLSDGVIELRLAKEWDIPDILIAHQDDPQLYRRLGMRRPPSGAELGRRSELEPTERAAGTGVRLTILDPGDDTCRGQLEVHDVRWAEGQAELDLWVAPQHRGRGLGTRALRLATDWLLGTCGLERVTLLAEPDNAPLLAAARAAGFATDKEAGSPTEEGGSPASGEEERPPGRVSLARARRPLAPPTA